MKALVISDTHFGAWTGEALLQHDAVLERLAPLLEDVDELILLGDLLDFLFSSIDKPSRSDGGRDSSDHRRSRPAMGQDAARPAGTNRSTSDPRAIRTSLTRWGGKRPCSTTPGVIARRVASATGLVISPW